MGMSPRDSDGEKDGRTGRNGRVFDLLVPLLQVVSAREATQLIDAEVFVPWRPPRRKRLLMRRELRLHGRMVHP